MKVEKTRAAIRPTAKRIPKIIKGLDDRPEGAVSMILTADGGGGETPTGGGGGGVSGREKEPKSGFEGGGGETGAGGGTGGGVSVTAGEPA